VSPTLTNFLFELVNVLMLVGALGYFVFKPLRGALDAERDRHATAEAEISARRADAEVLAGEVRESRQQVTQEAEKRRVELLAAAQKEAMEIEAAARSVVAAERAAADRELEAARQEQVASLAETLGQVAAASVEQLLGVLEGPDLDAALIRGACARLEGLGVRGGAGLVVESARPLTEEGEAALRAALGGPFAARHVPELGAGVRVTTPAGQVDATAVALAREAAEVVAASARAEDVVAVAQEDGAPGSAPAAEAGDA